MPAIVLIDRSHRQSRQSCLPAAAKSVFPVHRMHRLLIERIVYEFCTARETVADHG